MKKVIHQKVNAHLGIIENRSIGHGVMYQIIKKEDLYRKLVCISHWSEEDFEMERQYKQEWKDNDYEPDYIIQSFAELKNVIESLETKKNID